MLDLHARRVIGYRRNGDPIYWISGGAITAFWYGPAFLSVFNKEIDINSDAIYTALLTSSYTPNQDTHDYWNDAVANEITGTGYVANGFAETTLTSAYTGGTNVWNFDADDALWTTSTLTARYAIVYDRTPGTDATRPLVSYVDFGTDQSSSGGDFKIVWNASGIVKVTVS